MSETYNLRKHIFVKKLADADDPQLAQYLKGDGLNTPTWFVEQVVERDDGVELICRWEECPWDELDFLIDDIEGCRRVDRCYVTLEFKDEMAREERLAAMRAKITEVLSPAELAQFEKLLGK